MIAGDLLTKYRRKGLLVDTNLLLLYFVGACKRDHISRFKRTKQFATEDWSTLLGIFRLFKPIVTTPNILTEVSNLAGQLEEPLRTRCFELFARGIALLHEEYLPGAELAQTSAFPRFGITDAGVLQLAKGNYLVLTDDFRLSQYLQSQGADAINFNHIRVAGWEWS